MTSRMSRARQKAGKRPVDPTVCRQCGGVATYRVDTRVFDLMLRPDHQLTGATEYLCPPCTRAALTAIDRNPGLVMR